MKTQCEKILDYMKEHGEISQREAIYLGCYRLASRIHDIKRSGIRIKTETREVENVDGTKSHIAVYSIVKDGEENG